MASGSSGCWRGSSCPDHSGKQAITDITAAALIALTEVYNNVFVRTKTGSTVNFHFDYEDENIKISSIRTEKTTVEIDAKQKEDLRIRVPRWTPVKSIHLTVNGKSISPAVKDHFLTVSKSLLPGHIVLTYDLPVNTEIETAHGVDYTLTWRGDEIIGICPNSDFYPFYPTGECGVDTVD